ncbi:MAG: hypothetical protein EOP04_01765 [Proteobacteria bacterium]|nr:MAG: hypothetical protein EOP04_01765 [Pseudomonadota bacterium]
MGADETEKQPKDWLWIVGVVIVVLFVVLYFASLGKLDFVSETKDPGESELEKRSRAEARHKKLLWMVERKKGLKARLDLRFKIAYAAAQTILMTAFSSFFLGAYFLLKKDLGLTMDTLGAGVVWIGVGNAVFFLGKYKLSDGVRYIKTEVENRVYGRYLHIDDQIQKLQNEATEISVQLIAVPAVAEHPAPDSNLID